MPSRTRSPNAKSRWHPSGSVSMKLLLTNTTCLQMSQGARKRTVRVGVGAGGPSSTSPGKMLLTTRSGCRRRPGNTIACRQRRNGNMRPVQGPQVGIGGAMIWAGAVPIAADAAASGITNQRRRWAIRSEPVRFARHSWECVGVDLLGVSRSVRWQREPMRIL